MNPLDTLQAALDSVLSGRYKSLVRERGEVTLTVSAADYLAVAAMLRDAPGCASSS